jgi:hypothetical protein
MATACTQCGAALIENEAFYGKCGAAIIEGAAFCVKCGAKMSPASPTPFLSLKVVAAAQCLFAFAVLFSRIQSTSAHGVGADALCNAGGSVCVPQETRNMPLTNPFDITVTVAGIVGDLSWQLDDQTGQELESGKASDDPNWGGGSNPNSPQTIHIKEFVLVLPKSSTGALKLSPVKADTQGGSAQLPQLVIPVQFPSATSTLTVMVPKSFDQYQSEVNQRDPASFHPKSPFIKQSLTVLPVKDVVFASAEAAAENPSIHTQAPIRIIHFAVQGGKAFVDLNLTQEGYGWAGISSTIAAVEPLIEKTLLQFPNIHSVVFIWPPPVGASSSSALPEVLSVQSPRGADSGMTAWWGNRLRNCYLVPSSLDVGESGR